MDAEAEDEDLEPIDDDEAIPGREPVSLHLSICGDPPQVVVTCNVMGGAASAEEALARLLNAAAPSRPSSDQV